MNQRTRIIVVGAIVATLLLATVAGLGLSGSDSGKPGSFSDIKVSGDYGDKPDVTIPDGSAPSKLEVKVLTEGTGAEVKSGSILVAHYLGTTWAKRDGKMNIFDNSYDRGEPTPFPIGNGSVIAAWDQALVGKKLGSRVLLSAPPALAYGEGTPDPSQQGGAGLKGETLVFVVDLVDALAPDLAADGTEQTAPGSGFPAVTSKSGKAPVITSVDGVAVPTASKSALLLKGTGAKLDPKKSVYVQYVETSLKGFAQKQIVSSWEPGTQMSGPKQLPYEQLVGTIPALKDATIGTRILIVEPKADAKDDATIMIVDVLKQG